MFECALKLNLTMKFVPANGVCFVDSSYKIIPIVFMQQQSILTKLNSIQTVVNHCTASKAEQTHLKQWCGAVPQLACDGNRHDGVSYVSDAQDL